MDCKNLQSGDWFSMEYGYSRHDWYVLWATPEEVCFCKPSWCVSSANQWSVSQLEANNPVYLGRTKRRWISYVFNLDIICPFRRLGMFNRPAIFKPPKEGEQPEVKSQANEEWPEYVSGKWK